MDRVAELGRYAAEWFLVEIAPERFDEAFFAWLDRASEELSVDFVSIGGLVEADIRQVERQMPFPLPDDLRQFYLRYSPWGVLREWTGWDHTKLGVRQASGIDIPLVPIDHRSLQASGSDIVAAVESAVRYRIIEWSRSTGEVRIYESLRSYFIAQVESEVRLSFE